MSEPSPKKPSFLKRVLAFFLLLLCIGIGGGIVFYAKHTQYPPVAATTATPSTPLPPPVATAKTTGDNQDTLDLPQPILGDTQTAEPTPEPAAMLELNPAPTETTDNPSEALATARTDQALSDKIAALQQDVLQLMEKNAALTAKIDALQTQAQNGPQRDLSLLLAINHLQNSWQRPGGFSAELDLVERLTANDTGLNAITAKLSPMAKTGIRSVADLTADFTIIASQASQQQAKSRGAAWAANWAGEGMIADTIGKLRGLVTIRRTSGDSADPLERDLQQIQTALGAQQWADASRIVRTWPDTWQTTASKNWAEQLQHRADAEAAIWSLQDLIVRRLGQPVTN